MIKIKTDKKANQNRMNVKSRKGAKGKFDKLVVARRKFEKKAINKDYACINQKKFCYQFVLTDKKKDGIKKGFAKLFVNDKKIYSNSFKTGKSAVKKFGKCGKK